MLYAVSTLVLVLIGLGLWKRFNRKVHIPLMLSAFAIDLILVMVIELQRHVVEETVADPAGMGWLKLFHIAVSTLVLVLYGLMIYSGISVIKNKPMARVMHRTFAVIFIILRLVNYVTSFMIT